MPHMRSLWPVIACSFAVAAWLATGVLGEAGLAALVVAGVGAALLGTPIAAAWVHLQPTRFAGTRRMGLAAALFIAALVFATPLAVLDVSGWLVGPAVVLVWILFRPRWARVGVPAVALGGLVFAGLGISAPATDRWMLLEPVWSGFGSWAPSALIVGALAVAPFAAWWVRPGAERRQPIAVMVGVSLLVATGFAGLLATTNGMGPDFAAPITLLAGGVVVAGTTSSARPEEPSGGDWQIVGVGILLTVLFVGPGQSALPLLWSTGVPLTLGILALAIAARNGVLSRGHRVWLLAVTVACFWFASSGWSGLPDSTAAAVVLASLPVIATWTLGTAAVRTRTAAGAT